MNQRAGGSLAYTVDGQGLVLSVGEVTPPDLTPARADTTPHVALRTLVAPLTWEPVQRLLAWGAREGMTAAELLDTAGRRHTRRHDDDGVHDDTNSPRRPRERQHAL